MCVEKGPIKPCVLTDCAQSVPTHTHTHTHTGGVLKAYMVHGIPPLVSSRQLYDHPNPFLPVSSHTLKHSYCIPYSGNLPLVHIRLYSNVNPYTDLHIQRHTYTTRGGYKEKDKSHEYLGISECTLPELFLWLKSSGNIFNEKMLQPACCSCH